MNGSRRARPPRFDAGAEIRLRLATGGDDAALERLAQLSGRVKAPGAWVVAEVDGQLYAALPLDDGDALADPFRPTCELHGLLVLRRKQLRADPSVSRSSMRRRRFRSIFGRGSQPPVLTS